MWGRKKQYMKRRAKAHMRARMRMPRGAGSARKKGDAGKPPGRILAAIWRPDSGRHLAARNPAANNNSLHWPESGPKTAAGIRPPNRCHVRGHFGLIWGAAVAQLPLNFFAQWVPLCERMQVDFRLHLPQKLANKGRLLQRPQTIL